MAKHLVTIQSFVLNLLDWFYKPFRKIIPPETFRYAAMGGINTFLDIFLYFICYNFILSKQMVDLGFVAISPHIASFIFVFPITFFTGFLAGKYITFTRFIFKRANSAFQVCCGCNWINCPELYIVKAFC